MQLERQRSLRSIESGNAESGNAGPVSNDQLQSGLNKALQQIDPSGRIDPGAKEKILKILIYMVKFLFTNVLAHAYLSLYVDKSPNNLRRLGFSGSLVLGGSYGVAHAFSNFWHDGESGEGLHRQRTITGTIVFVLTNIIFAHIILSITRWLYNNFESREALVKKLQTIFAEDAKRNGQLTSTSSNTTP